MSTLPMEMWTAVLIRGLHCNSLRRMQRVWTKKILCIHVVLFEEDYIMHITNVLVSVHTKESQHSTLIRTAIHTPVVMGQYRQALTQDLIHDCKEGKWKYVWMYASQKCIYLEAVLHYIQLGIYLMAAQHVKPLCFDVLFVHLINCHSNQRSFCIA